jgi:TIR domain
MQPQVFISHTDRAPADADFTNLVIQKFKQEGIAYWLDREHPFDFASQPSSDGPSPANPLFFHLCEAIADSDLLLFILSAASVQREYCRLEFDPRVLLGPAAQVMAGKSALIVKLDDLKFSEIEIVLTGLCGESHVIDMTAQTFESFWQTFMEVYQQTVIRPKDETWRQHLSFQPPREPDPVTADERDSLQAEGRNLLAIALTRMAENKLEEAGELLADAYQAFDRAGDARSAADVLYSTFTVYLRMGLENFAGEHEVVTIGSIVIKDTRKMALEDIRYAMKCLRGCIDELSALGEESLSLEMEKRFDDALRLLAENGIVRVAG